MSPEVKSGLRSGRRRFTPHPTASRSRTLTLFVQVALEGVRAQARSPRDASHSQRPHTRQVRLWRRSEFVPRHGLRGVTSSSSTANPAFSSLQCTSVVAVSSSSTLHRPDPERFSSVLAKSRGGSPDLLLSLFLGHLVAIFSRCCAVCK